MECRTEGEVKGKCRDCACIVRQLTHCFGLQKSLGHISITMDMWSNPELDGFKGVTGHFMEQDNDGNVVEAACMLAF